MKIRILAVAAVAAIALALISSSHVYAADPGPCMGHDALNAARVNELHAELRLTPQQESSWQNLMTTMHSMNQPHPAMASVAQLTTPQRLDLAMQMLQAHEREANEHFTAVKSFYATLNPQQRQIFDRETLALHSGM